MNEHQTPPGQQRQDAVQCPHCEQVTMPNLLTDGSYVCSCSAERALPQEGDQPGLPAPMDEPTPPHAGPGPLPPDHGQFGRDVATEEFLPLADSPGR